MQAADLDRFALGDKFNKANPLADSIFKMGSGQVANTSAVEQQFGDMMTALYKESGSSLRIEILKNSEVSKFIDDHARVLDNSFEFTKMSDLMKQRLKESDWMFSGMKTFHELNEAFPSLLDEKGERKSFERFLNDVLKIDSTYNRNYLNAEYNFAQASAGMAAKWEDFLDDGDDYYLQYRTAGDSNVRPEHAELNGITLPASDKFWDTYFPPNGWNCRCTVVQVRKDKYTPTPHDQAMSRGSRAMANEKTAKMFAFNPGKQQKVFPDYNPYTISKCATCDKAKLNLTFIPDNQVCEACEFAKKCFIGKEEIIKVRNDTVKISKLINPESSDYKKLKQIAEHFASLGAEVEMTPKMSRPAAFVYDCYYKDLRGTKYEGKCPDLRIDGIWYEHEGFTTKNPVNAFNNMLNHGLKQSSRIIIDQPELTDAFMKKAIRRRIYTSGQVIDEVWIRSDSGIRFLYKKS